MLSEIFFSSIKLLLCFILAFALYLFYLVIAKPLLWRRKYGAYPNVKVTNKFIPFLGDINKHIQSTNEGKVHYYYYEEEAEEMKKYDMLAKIEGSRPCLLLISTKAMLEFIGHQKTSAVDRADCKKGFIALVPDSIGPAKSDPEVLQRRKNMTKWLGLNAASKYIPHMINCCEKVLDKMNKEKTSDISHWMTELTFNIFTGLLFGDDVGELVSKLYPYQNADGSTENITLEEMMIRLGVCYAEQMYNPVGLMFPFVSEKKLINPFKRDDKNAKVFKAAISLIQSTSKDTTSIGYKFYTNPDPTEAQNLDDLITVMLAGTETVAHHLVSFFFFMNKYPEYFEKVKEELKREGLVKGKKFTDNCTLDRLQNCTYLTCLIKETLRKDAPASDANDYLAYRNIEICGVPIPKGGRIKIDIMTSHFDDDRWLQPHDFIPDRHDMDSEFYKESKEAGKVADAYSRRTFSHGTRNCPGQSFSMLESKVALAYFITHMDFQFPQIDLNTSGIGFGIGTQFTPKISITKF